MPKSLEDNWKDAEHFRKRSDESANFLRTLLFGSSGLWLVRIAEKPDTHRDLYDYISMISLGVAIILIWGSWDIQKSKSIRRQQYIENNGIESYVRNNIQAEGTKNYELDLFAFFCIIIGGVAQIVPYPLLCK